MILATELHNARILVVDDQEANVMLLEQMLENAGYLNVTSTMDPYAVCGLHLANHYDLILLDLQMPGMDGFEVLAGLHDIEPDGYVPVLVVTAQPGHKLRALQAGARDFVSKPFELVEVETRIHNLLEVRLLHQKLNRYNQQLESTVLERTAELRASEQRFQRYTELSSDWYWEQDAEGELTRCYGPVADMVGIGAEGASSLFAGSWDPDERAQLEAHISERRPFLDFVYRRGHADGSVQYLQVSGEPMFDEASRFTGYRGIGMDVTGRRQTDPLQARMNKAVDAIGTGICVLDGASMAIVEVNQGLCRMCGSSRADLLAAGAAALGLGSTDWLAGRHARLLAGDRLPREAGHLLRADGSKLAVTLEWTALADIGGGSLVVTAVVTE